MRISKVCPKCESEDLLVIENGPGGFYYYGNTIPVKGFLEEAVVIKRMVCCNCGFTEEWIPQYDIERLKKTYSKGKGAK